VGFEPMIPTSERAKIVHALDRSATVTGHLPDYMVLITYHIPCEIYIYIYIYIYSN
jgi:hypothetical protein